MLPGFYGSALTAFFSLLYFTLLCRDIAKRLVETHEIKKYEKGIFFFISNEVLYFSKNKHNLDYS
jgi:hypothetical protein